MILPFHDDEAQRRQSVADHAKSILVPEIVNLKEKYSVEPISVSRSKTRLFDSSRIYEDQPSHSRLKGEQCGSFLGLICDTWTRQFVPKKGIVSEEGNSCILHGKLHSY
jgi:hypothetical protein